MTKLKNKCFSKFAIPAILFSGALFQSEIGFAQGIGISSTAITPDASAVLELRSSTQGVLVPRMTTIERNAIPSPAAGLLIYNTTTLAFNYYQAGWNTLSGAGGVAAVTGSGNISSTGGTTPNLTFTGTLPVANGGTGLTTGTAGGILGFTAAGTLASSTALTLNALIIGNGAATTPTSLAIGTANQVLGMNTVGTAHEYKTLTGTTNQVSLVPGANTIAFSTPQNIHTAATPTFAGLTLSGLTAANAFVYSGAGKVLTSTAAPVNGQLLIGSTGAVPVAANLTAGSGIAITNEAGSVTISNGAITLASNVTNSTTTYANVTGLAFNVVAGTFYRFRIYIPYTSAVITTGSRWTLSGPAITQLNYNSQYTLSATTQTINYASAYSIPAAANASSLATGNMTIIEGVIQCSAGGSVQVQFASEIAGSAITALAGASIEVW